MHDVTTQSTGAVGRQPAVDYDPASYEIQADPFPVYRWLRDDAPLYWSERYGFYALSRFEDALAVYTAPEIYSSAAGPQLEARGDALAMQQEMMIAKDPPRHTQLRKLVSRAFTPRRVAELEPFVRGICQELLDELSATGDGDWIASFGSLLPSTVITTLMGYPASYRERLRILTDRLMHREPGELSPSADASAAGTELYLMLADLVQERRANPGVDMCSALVHAEIMEDGERQVLDDHQIAMFYVLLAVAGYETTTKLLGNLVVQLEQFRDQRKLVVDDLTLVSNTIDESLRYEGPAQYQIRLTTEPVRWYGMSLPAGTRMVVVNGAANRDEREFPDPDAFNVRRNASRHLAFGHGIHFCLGASLARMEAAVALQELLSRFPGYEVDLDGLERKWSSNFRGWSKVPITLT